MADTEAQIGSELVSQRGRYHRGYKGPTLSLIGPSFTLCYCCNAHKPPVTSQRALPSPHSLKRLCQVNDMKQSDEVVFGSAL